MIYIIILIGLVFIAVGMILTEGNAKYLLSGYNTMSEAQRKKVDLPSFIPFFRIFHIFLGLTTMIISAALYLYVSEIYSAIFLAVYPILGYIYFIWKSTRFSSSTNSRNSNLGIGVLLATLIFVIYVFTTGMKESDLIIGVDHLTLTGAYGSTLEIQSLESIKMAEHLPKVSKRSNGFSIGNVRKGIYQLQNGKKVKLILNNKDEPLIHILSKDGKSTYFSAKEESNTDVFENLKNAFPTLTNQQ